jgi:hypothetical protein
MLWGCKLPARGMQMAPLMLGLLCHIRREGLKVGIGEVTATEVTATEVTARLKQTGVCA